MRLYHTHQEYHDTYYGARSRLSSIPNLSLYPLYAWRRRTRSKLREVRCVDGTQNDSSLPMDVMLLLEPSNQADFLNNLDRPTQ